MLSAVIRTARLIEMVGKIRIQIVPSDYFKPGFVILEL